MKRSLLVTGGAGFIGANFVHYWLGAHPADRLVVLDALTYAGNPRNLDGAYDRDGFRFIEGNILDAELVRATLRDEQIDLVVHFAAESHVDRSIAGSAAFVSTNVLGTHTLLQSAHDVWTAGGRSGHFHHVSTDEVYGSLEPTDPAFTESSPYQPNSPYAASKAGSDHLVRAFHATYGLRTTLSNCSNNYGPLQFPEKLIPLAIVRMLSAQPIPVYGDGRNVRDWLYVKDHCVGIDCVLGSGESGSVFNIGGGAELQNIVLVNLLCDLVDEELLAGAAYRAAFPASPVFGGGCSRDLIAYVKDRPGHDRRYAIDSRKAESQLGYVASVTIEQGLRQTVRWYLQHPSWWQPLLG